MRVECLAAVSVAAHGLLLRIDPVAILRLRTDDDGARRANHREPVLFYRAINAEHEDIIAHDLRVVGGEIAINRALEFVALTGQLLWQ